MKIGQIIKNKKGQIKANFSSKICQTIRFKLAFHKTLQVLGRYLQNRLLNIPLFNIQKRPKKHNGQTILILTTNPFQKKAKWQTYINRPGLSDLRVTLSSTNHVINSPLKTPESIESDLVETHFSYQIVRDMSKTNTNMVQQGI